VTTVLLDRHDASEEADGIGRIPPSSTGNAASGSPLQQRCRAPRRARRFATFSEFVDQLIAQGRAPAWRFAPERLRLAADGTVTARNIGGEVHTFSEVANFGGGCIGFLNDLLGLSPVPECAGFPGGVFGATAVPAGGTLTVTLAPGIHRFECLIHPWMRATVDVG
jgi:plastocyanin